MTATAPSPTPISIKTRSPSSSSAFARWQHDNAAGPAAPAASPGATLTSPKAIPRSTSAALSDLSASSSSDSPINLAAMAAARPSHSPDVLIADPSSSSSAAAAAALADSIQNLSLDEDAAKESLRLRSSSLDNVGGATPRQQQQEDIDIAASIARAMEEIAGIKSTLFELEEKRHANVQTTSKETELAVIRIDDRLETISRIMQQLTVALRSDDEDAAGDTTIISHHDDEGSDSDDDDDFALPGVTLSSRNPKQRFEELAKAWDAVQDEVETFKKELRDDKYISHFHSASSQAEELMDSLDKALTLAANFIDAHRAKPTASDHDDEEARETLQRLHGVRKTLKTKRNYYCPAIEQTFAAFERSLKERATRHGMLLRNFSELKSRWRDLRLKTSKMERELKRIEAGMTGQGELAMSKSHDNLLFPATPSRGGAPQPGHGRLTPGLPAKSRMRTTSSVSAGAGVGPSASASDVPPVPPLSPPAPAKPLKSTRRLVSGPGETTMTAASATGSPMRSGMTSSPSASSLLTRSPAHGMMGATPSRHGRSASSGSPEPNLLRSVERARGASTMDAAFRSSPLSRTSVLPEARAAAERPPVPLTAAAAAAAASSSTATPAKRVSHTLTSRPPSSFRFRSRDEGIAPASSSSSRVTPQRGVPPRSLRAGSEPPMAEQEPRSIRPMSALGGASPRTERRMSRAMGSSGVDSYGDESMETLSVTSSRPGSATGSYYSNYPSHYRPPSSATTHVDPESKAARRQSRIPTFTFPGTPGSSSDVYEGGIPRPGSSMSQASSSAAGSIATPRRFGASRSTMQTPEPVMAARVQRLSVYSKPSTGGTAASTSAANRRTSMMMTTPGASTSSSRPPTTRFNPRSPASSILSSSSGSRYSTSATSSITAGRTTPLSASALAKIPHARPLSVLGTSSGTGEPIRSVYAQSIGGGSASSVANYRTSRTSATTASNRLSGLPRGASSRSVSAYAAGGAGSTRDGAATPTFSERSGHSSYSYAPMQAGSSSSSAAYRPNPLDALDVAVSTVTNALGVPLTRVDPHLPRGVKTETGPGKEVRCRYSFGGGAAAVCKLLELHRATVEGGVQRKVLVKVPGKGFLDLELWLLSAFD